MSLDAESVYREQLSADEPDILITALDEVIPPDTEGDDLTTRLARDLCFEPAEIGGTKLEQPFSELHPRMLTHGIRQVALANTVLADESISGSLPDWFDRKLFLQGLLVADAGLSLVPAEQVENMHQYGPKYSSVLSPDYDKHPAYGLDMAQSLSPLDEPKTQRLAAMIGRHHSIQARHAYGPDWDEIPHDLIDDPSEIDLLIMLQKPYDYYDDHMGRLDGDAEDFAAKTETAHHRFAGSIGTLLCKNLALAGMMEDRGFDPNLPYRISAGIQTEVLGDTAIGDAYRSLRPDLVMDEASA